MIDELLTNWKVPQQCTEDEAWQKLQQRIATQTKVVPLWKRPLSWAAAAAVALLLVATFVFSEGSYEELKAEAPQRVVLPDGSMAHVNEGAFLRWSSDWQRNARLLELDGEAFFQVNKGEKFRVATAHGAVEVLGTRFNVYADDEDFRVDCFEGKVKVTGGELSVELTAGQAVKLRNGQLGDRFAIAQVQPSWLMGGFNYTNASLERVLRDIEQRFGVNIVRPDDTRNEEFSGSFEASSAAESLELIALAFGLQYSRIDDVTFALER